MASISAAHNRFYLRSVIKDSAVPIVHGNRPQDNSELPLDL
jgi:hypothetical protein